MKNITTLTFNDKDNLDLKIELELNSQNFLHLEKAISNHIESQKALIGNQTKESLEKYGDNKECYQYLVGYMEKLRDDLRKEYNTKCNPSKKWS